MLEIASFDDAPVSSWKRLGPEPKDSLENSMGQSHTNFYLLENKYCRKFLSLDNVDDFLELSFIYLQDFVYFSSCI